jgi:hypothetical protein
MDESELDLSCIGLVTAVGEVVEDGFWLRRGCVAAR